MVPNFANPHSLSQDVEITTRSEIAERTGFTSVVYDENSDSLKRDLDNLLRDTWAETLAETCSPRAKKHLKAASEVRKNEDDPFMLTEGRRFSKHPIAFRLVSSMRYPQHISLDSKPPSSLVYVFHYP